MAFDCDVDKAFACVDRIEHEGVDVDTLERVPTRFKSLDVKIRAAMAKRTVGKGAGSAAALVSRLTHKRDELRQAHPIGPDSRAANTVFGVQILPCA